MPDPLKVFVASSGSQRGVARVFGEALTASASDLGVTLDVVPWFREDVARAGSDILTNLIDQCKGNESMHGSDFFVAFLTPDDMIEKKGQWTETPRDNCIFELGLFIGGLGFHWERCFWLCSVSQGALPSDIKNRIYVPFEQPPARQPLEIRQALAPAIRTVRDQIISLRKFFALEFESITISELMERERPKRKKGRLDDQDAEVLVNRAQPVEERLPEVAAQVMLNLRDGVKYRYFFHDLKKSDGLISRLFYNLATANPDANGKLKKDVLKPAEIRGNLDLIKNYLSIHLLQSNGPMEFCVHNAHVEPTCYLRHKEKQKFLLWCQKDDACNIVADLTNLFKLDRELTPLQVFRTPKYVFDPDLYAAGKSAIWGAIQAQFNRSEFQFAGEDESFLKSVCFGEENV